mmetsp:Transcript_50755/g.127918  ORF Transcript_50755/g.127918 Transcript_50755/m.127918 type:complete len:698 (-) Transcript_50755:419-2512(-)
MRASRQISGGGPDAKDMLRHFSVIMEEPSLEVEEGNVISTVFYHLRVFCHERPQSGDGKNGSKEYLWRVCRRFTDFEELNRDLRARQLLPASVVAPKKTLLWHLVPSKAFAQQRSVELLTFLRAALSAIEAVAEDSAATVARDPAAKAAPPAAPPDLSELSEELAKFLGLEEPLALPSAADTRVKGRAEASEVPSVLRRWRLPEDAEERTAKLVHSLDKGIFIVDHRDPGPPSCRLRQVDKQATLGDLAVVVAEAKSIAPPCSGGSGGRASFSGPPSPMLSAAPSPRPVARRSSTPLSSSSPPQQGHPSSSPSWRFQSPPSSLGSTPSVSRLPSPACSPSQSRCPSPPRMSGLSPSAGDECSSWSSVSTTDTEPPRQYDVCSKPDAGVWLEVELHGELVRYQDHRKWWAEVQGSGPRVTKEGRKNSKEAEVRGASRVDQGSSAARMSAKDKEEKAKQERASMVAQLEMSAALFRELSARHEDLHPILGYGAEGRKFIVVQQAAPHCRGLRSLPFSPQRCHRVLGQALKALLHMHEQFLGHGFLSPESLLVDEGSMGLHVSLAWTPGQRRPEGHAIATLGFRGPGDLPGDPANDIWALACVILAWWGGFTPVPHPWTQFARSQNLQKDIQAALSEQPPLLPKALLDLHAAAAIAEEPEHSFLSLLASLLTRCLIWQPSERPSAADLLHDRFFEQALVL